MLQQLRLLYCHSNVAQPSSLAATVTAAGTATATALLVTKACCCCCIPGHAVAPGASGSGGGGIGGGGSSTCKRCDKAEQRWSVDATPSFLYTPAHSHVQTCASVLGARASL
jgi:hypothetical protein